MTNTATPAADPGLPNAKPPSDLDAVISANRARYARIDSLTRAAFAVEDRVGLFAVEDRVGLDAFRARLRLTAAALDLPETAIAKLLKVHPRTFDSGHWIMTRAVPWAQEHGVNLDWLIAGSVEHLLRDVQALRRRRAEPSSEEAAA